MYVCILYHQCITNVGIISLYVGKETNYYLLDTRKSAKDPGTL